MGEAFRASIAGFFAFHFEASSAVSYEEEDTCVSYEEEDTWVSSLHCTSRPLPPW
jgi:hypothetical protein